MVETKSEQKKVILVGVNLSNDHHFERSMKELEALAEACDLLVAGRVVQNLDRPTQALFLGTGKVGEVREEAVRKRADLVVFDNALTPMQLRNLQSEIGVSVLDRTALILDIFAVRARSREAKLQVEVAKLQYMLPRLAGLHASLSRQGGSGGGNGGGSGFSNKGAGETRMELDRRRIEHRLAELRRELKDVERERMTQRKQRANSETKRVALVGYTNAGKSTLMNAFLETYLSKEGSERERLSEKMVFEKDMLFATLDTTVRRIPLPNNKDFLLSDTVGFIDKLPHDLVQAFRSTLEEAKEADLILQVVDCSDENYKDQIQITNKTLRDLEADGIPMIYVFNKADKKFSDQPEVVLPIVKEDRIFISAKEKVGMKELTDLISSRLYAGHISCEMLIPYEDGAVTSYLNEKADIRQTEYLAAGTKLILELSKSDFDKYQKYVIL